MFSPALAGIDPQNHCGSVCLPLKRDMKLLVAIANYGYKNDAFLARVLSEYRKMSFDTDIVVLSNVRKELGNDVKVLTGTPTRDPHSLPFGHKQVFAARRDDYDLFVYTEDDILITQRNIEAFLEASNVLDPQELAGFFRWEEYPDGRRFFPDAHFFYRWLPGSVTAAGKTLFARFTNDHSGCFALTRGQLAKAIESGGFLVGPHEGMYSQLETAATDPYTQCGFEKLICLSRFDDFLVHHLPNKYIGSPLGVDAAEFEVQMQRLCDRWESPAATASLLEPRTKVFHCRWSKNCYEPRRDDLTGIYGPSVTSVLSIGCGWGESEAAIEGRGIKVTAIPIDSVIAACAETRGVEVVCGEWDNAIRLLEGRRFDGVLMSGILHLLREPEKALQQAAALLRHEGTLVATIPAFHRLPILWERLNHPSRYRDWGNFQRSGIHSVSRRLLRSWFRRAGLSKQKTLSNIPKRWTGIAGKAPRMAGALLASEYVLVGRRTGTRATEFSPRTGAGLSEAESDVTYTAERSAM